ncbi:MAG: ABC transporter substrate-binding protein [Immundisolibacterales bacterium]|nr:ABC transporter substrate-binding protein [Immundisolibacterales bacterium]
MNSHVTRLRRLRRHGAALLSAAALAFAAHAATAQTAIKFALDWKFEGPSAPYFVAIDNGYFAAEGLDVTIDSGPGSVKGITRIAAGTYPIGFMDINSLAKFLDQNPDGAVTAILMVYNRPPFAIVSTAERGVLKPKDLEGRILGAPAPDGAYAQWKAFVKVNDIDASKVQIENVGFPVREPMLAKGDVDAITGYSFSSYFNLIRNGVAPEDVKVMMMADYGLDLYGNAIMVNTDFAKANPDVVKGFVAATIKGVQATAADPDTAIKSVMKRNEIADEALELARLKMALRDNIVTDEVKQNGFGGVDPARLASSLDQIGVTYEFTNRPEPSAVFDSSYLPPAQDRQL